MMSSLGISRFKLLFWMLILFTPILLGPVKIAAQENVDLDFRETDIKEVLRLIAQKSGTNIIAEKSVRGNVSVRLKDVYYEEAMNLIAKTNGLAVRKIGNTWIVANDKVMASQFDKGLTLTKRLQYAKAADASKIITSTIKKDVKVATDDRINAVIISGGKEVLDEVKKLLETIDTPVHQVMIEAKIVEVKTRAAKNIGFVWGAQAQNGTYGEGEGDKSGTFPVLRTKENFAQNPDAGLYQNLSGEMGSLFGLGDFYRENLLFRATFTALEDMGETKTLSNPKIATVNGQQANIVVGTKVIYPGGADQPPKEKDTGIKLQITPRVNDDGYITVEAEPEVSQVDDWKNQYPVIGTRSAKTTVRVRDGEEILIGGLIKDIEGKSQQKLPLLGNIPLIKSLFTYKDRNGESQELIILITPHIIAQSIESAAPLSMIPEGGFEGSAPITGTQPMGTAGDAFDSTFDSAFR